MGSDAPIGLFDSGVGGLTVLRAVRESLPAEHLIYLGDTARVPYGTKGPETVRTYARNIADHLLAAGCKALVIACNTASAYAADAVRAHAPVPVIDVIDPVAAQIAGSFPSHTVAILGTRGTVASHAYPRAIAAHARAVRVLQQACPMLVPLAEEGWTEGPIPTAIVDVYLRELASVGVPDALVLGCTHYPLLERVIAASARRIFDRDVAVIDSARATAATLAATLAAHDLARNGTDAGSERFLATDHPASLIAVAERFLGRPIPHAEHVDIGG